MLRLLKKVTTLLLNLRETESPSAEPVKGLPHSPQLDREEGPLRPHLRASVSQHHALSGHRGSMVPISQDQGGQSLRFQKRISFLIATGRAGLRRPDSGPRRAPSLPCSQGRMGPLPMGTAGVPPPPTLGGPEEQHHPNLKSERTPTGRRGNSRTAHTMRRPALPLHLKDQNKPSSWEVEARHRSSLEAREGLCCHSLKGPEGVPLPLSLAVREGPRPATLWAQGGRIPVSLKDPEAKRQISCQDPGGFSLSSSRSRE